MKPLIAIILMMLILPVSSAANCILTMGYKESAKEPLINAGNDNSGAYLALFSMAAKQIGCSLEIIRLPKKRLHKMFAQGSLDFYPGASFSLAREKYLFYIANGFSTSEYGISDVSMPEISSYRQLTTNKTIWLQEIGSSKADIAKRLNIETITINKLTMDISRRILVRHKNTFAVIDREIHDYYLKANQLTSIKEIGLKLHRHCCGNEKPMYLGFSKYSVHFKQKVNPDYQPEEPLSPTNSTAILHKNSIAYLFSEALKQLQETGVTDRVYQKYFNKL